MRKRLMKIVVFIVVLALLIALPLAVSADQPQVKVSGTLRPLVVSSSNCGECPGLYGWQDNPTLGNQAGVCFVPPATVNGSGLVLACDYTNGQVVVIKSSN
jgi:hypothetical protein